MQSTAASPQSFQALLTGFEAQTWYLDSGFLHHPSCHIWPMQPNSKHSLLQIWSSRHGEWSEWTRSVHKSIDSSYFSSPVHSTLIWSSTIYSLFLTWSLRTWLVLINLLKMIIPLNFFPSIVFLNPRTPVKCCWRALWDMMNCTGSQILSFQEMVLLVLVCRIPQFYPLPFLQNTTVCISYV